MANLGYVSSFNINGNELSLKDAALTEIVEEIIEAIGANNGDISERINNLHDRAFDALIKISSQNESEISNIQDGLYKIQYVTVTGEGEEATETLNNSAILIQDGTNQYLYKDGQLSSRTKTDSTWGNWITFEGGVTSVNGMTGVVTITETQLSKGTATGTGNAVTDINVSNHQITLVKGATYATQSDIDTSIANLVDSAPETLNTLNELAEALGNDENFATTIATQIGEKYTKPSTGIPASDLATGVIPDVPVQSVNGMTGAVTINVGVTSFNGSTGAVTYTSPVTSVNGMTGAVTINVPSKTSDLTNDSEFIKNNQTSIVINADEDVYLAGGTFNNNGKNRIHIHPGGAYVTVAESEKFYYNDKEVATVDQIVTPPVTSVNGQTGAVTVDAGVTSFNGSTGAVTYTSPVTSVNGQTGAVTITIPEVQLSNNYTTSTDTNEDLELASGDSYEEAFGKLEKAIIDNELVVTNAIADLDSRVTDTESLATVAKSGSYNDLTNRPTIPTKTSDLTNDSGFLTEAPVTSVNGQTGAVNINVGVTSFNGSTGTVTYTAPVSSVNGMTGTVNIDLSNYIIDEGNGITSIIKGNGSEDTVIATHLGAGYGAIDVNPAGVNIISNWGGDSNYGQTGTNNIYLQTSQGKAYYNSKEIATVDQIVTPPVTSVNGQTGAVTVKENVQADWNATTGDAVILNKPTIPAAVTESTVAGWGFTKNTGTLTTETQLSKGTATGTGNAVTDINVSNHQITLVKGATYATQEDINESISNLVNSAPTTLDTLNELATALGNDPNFATTVATQIGEKYTKPSTGIPASDLANGVIPDVPVQSVNGMTGAVNINVGVTSFNGSTGAVTYTAPVTSVNGATGAVTVDVGVTSFNGSTGAVTYTAPVTSVNGATGAVTVKENVQSDWNATTGDAVILNKPTIPTVNDSTVTITMNGNTVGTFTLNKSGNTTIDLGTVLTSHQSLKTINNESIVGTGNITISGGSSSGLPSVTAADNGKVLMVVNGEWTLVNHVSLYSGSGTPSNSQGNNGDIYIQS